MTVKEEIAMLNRQAAAIRQARIEMEEELARIERQSQSRPNCDDDADEEETSLKGRWMESAGGWCLEVQAGPDHPLAPNEWHTVAFLEQNRRGGWIVEIGSEFGIAGTACRKQTVASFEQAKALAERLTATVISEPE